MNYSKGSVRLNISVKVNLEQFILAMRLNFQYSLYSVLWSVFSEVAQGEVSFIPPLIPTHNQAFSILCFDNSGLLWLGLGKGVSKKIMFQFKINVLVAADSWRCLEALSKIRLEIVLRSPLKIQWCHAYRC